MAPPDCSTTHGGWDTASPRHWARQATQHRARQAPRPAVVRRAPRVVTGAWPVRAQPWPVRRVVPRGDCSPPAVARGLAARGRVPLAEALAQTTCPACRRATARHGQHDGVWDGARRVSLRTAGCDAAYWPVRMVLACTRSGVPGTWPCTMRQRSLPLAVLAGGAPALPPPQDCGVFFLRAEPLTLALSCARKRERGTSGRWRASAAVLC